MPAFQPAILILSLLLMTTTDSGAAPDHADVAYGSQPAQTLNLWLAEGEGPRPLVVHIHGGGWTNGQKQDHDGKAKRYLKRGISYASIGYRLTREAPLPAPVHDAARALQFLRANAATYNLDKQRVGLTGGSAGACTAMWLLYHDDLADPAAADPVARESTRVSAAVAFNGQTAIDPKLIEAWLGPKVLDHRMIWTSVGAESMAAALEAYDQYKELYTEFSPYNHVSAGDPPLFMVYMHPAAMPPENKNHAIHHPTFGFKLKEKADALGLECNLIIQGEPATGYDGPEGFLISKLLGEG